MQTASSFWHHQSSPNNTKHNPIGRQDFFFGRPKHQLDGAPSNCIPRVETKIATGWGD
jgi:hypothetical protein